VAAQAAGGQAPQAGGNPNPPATPQGNGPPGTVPANLPVEFTVSRSTL